MPALSKVESTRGEAGDEGFNHIVERYATHQAPDPQRELIVLDRDRIKHQAGIARVGEVLVGRRDTRVAPVTRHPEDRVQDLQRSRIDWHVHDDNFNP